MTQLLDVLSLSEYIERFRGAGIRDCAVIDRNLFYFVALQDWNDDRPRPFSDELETRLTSLDLKAEPRLLTTRGTGYSRLQCSGPREEGINCVAVDGRATVLVDKPSDCEVEQTIPEGGGVGPCRSNVTKIKPFAGRLYGCGGDRSLFFRQGPNDWAEVGPLPPAGGGGAGFMDFDGFNESDIYAGGGRGDVWHFDGSAWRKVRLPEKMWIESVCCGGDGHVYIGAQSGTVFRGRGDNWTMIQRGDLTLPFRDMVWFQDRVYATSDYGLWEIQDGQVRPSDAPIEITTCAGNLSVADGVMLMAGAYGAALHDGTSWSRLFSLIELEREAQTQEQNKSPT